MRTDTHVTEFNMSDGSGQKKNIYTPGRLVQVNVSDGHSRSDISNEKEKTETTAM